MASIFFMKWIFFKIKTNIENYKNFSIYKSAKQNSLKPTIQI